MAAADVTSPRLQTTTYAVLFAVTAGHLINDTLQALLLSIYPLLRDLHNLSFAQVGFITLAFQATASVLQPLIGHYTDKKPFPYSLPVAPALFVPIPPVVEEGVPQRCQFGPGLTRN